jgi:cytochrome c biogenesis protein CcmG/thiol:disulfide interchange protein DsbE
VDQGRIKAVAAVAVLAAVLGACGSSGDDGNPESRLTAAQAGEPLPDGAPAALANVREQASELLDGGTDAFAARLPELHGYPVVINKWASWCGPCRFEFPLFQTLASERGGEVAFLGVDSNDSEDAARTFLEELPLPYPSYSDPDQEIAATFLDNAREFPATAFYDSHGDLAFVHRGVYASEDALTADVDRYAR